MTQEVAAPARGRGGVVSIKWPRRRGIACVLLAALVLFMLACDGGCARVLGSKMVSTPNQGRTLAELGDSTPAELARRGISRQFRVEVGPPAASLSVWVIDPIETNIIQVGLPDGTGGKHLWEFGCDNRPKRPDHQPLGTVILLHGIYDSKLTFGVAMGRVLAAAGYRAVLVDLRGHGRSTGDWMTYGVVEANDVSQVITALEERHLLAGKLGILGVSYGGAVAIQTAAIDPRVEAVATLGAFSSLRDVVPPFGHRLVTKRLGTLAWWMLKPTIPDVIAAAGRAADFDPDQASPRIAIAHTKAAVVLIHGSSDDYVPVEEAEALFDAASGPARLVTVRGASHVGLIFLCLNDVRRISLDWFDQHLLGTPVRVSPPQIATAAPASNSGSPPMR